MVSPVSRSPTYASFCKHLKNWSSTYHATRLKHDPGSWAEEQDWDEVMPHEWPEMVVSAAAIGCAPLLRELLRRGGSATAPDRAGERPVFAAARSCSVRSLELLCNHGASLEEFEEGGMRVLHAALASPVISVWDGHYADTIGWLLDHGQSPTAPDAAGNTPLHHAAAVLNESVHDILLAAGAQWSARNQAGVCPAQILFEHYGKSDSSFPHWRAHVLAIYQAAQASLSAEELGEELPGGSGSPPRSPRF